MQCHFELLIILLLTSSDYRVRQASNFNCIVYLFYSIRAFLSSHSWIMDARLFALCDIKRDILLHSFYFLFQKHIFVQQVSTYKPGRLNFIQVLTFLIFRKTKRIVVCRIKKSYKIKIFLQGCTFKQYFTRLFLLFIFIGLLRH